MKQLSVNVRPLIKKVQIILERLAEARISSRYRIIFKGKGLEFEDFRTYNENDDADRIDWKASARANKLLIKEYIEERDLDINILLDVSSSMIFGSTEKLKNEYAAEFVATLSHLIIQTGDKAGLFMFSDNIRVKVPPANTENQFYMILKSLTNAENYGGKCNLNAAVKELMSTSKRRGVLIIVSDFIGLESNWDESLKIGSEKFDVIGVMIQDPRDFSLPKNIGKVLVSDPFSNKELLVDPDLIADEYEDYMNTQKKVVIHSFNSSNADFLYLPTNKSFIIPLLRLLERREQELA